MATRRQFLSALGAAPLLAQPVARPNILWITCEDMSPDLGCYGDPEAHTPNLDRFARQGVRFTNGFSVAGVCAPSRSAIITGMYPSTIGTHHMRSKGVPPPYVHCFTEYLRRAGYYCTNNFKTDYNFDCPLTAWDENSRTAHWRGRAQGQPFFSVFNHLVTHESQIRIDAEQFARNIQMLKPAERHDPARAKLPPYYPDTPIVRRDWTNYYDLITALDYQVATLLGQLEEDGLADNTIVFFFSDHGRGLPRAKRWIYDSGIHVPLMVRWPGQIAPGSVREDLVSFLDLAPTLLALAGVNIPAHLQGQSFLGSRTVRPREYIFAVRDRMDETYDMMRCIRDRRYKLIRNFQAGKPYVQYIDYMDQMPTMREMRRLHKDGKLVGPQKLFFRPEKPEFELYDTSADPHEINNLAGSPAHREVFDRLRRALEQWGKDTGDLGTIPEEQLQERMRPGGRWSTTAAPTITPSGGAFTGPVKVQVACPTEGASVAYTTESSDNARWKLFTNEIVLARGGILRAKACRLGYYDSSEVKAEFRLG